jgi:hypothetical protein
VPSTPSSKWTAPFSAHNGKCSGPDVAASRIWRPISAGRQFRGFAQNPPEVVIVCWSNEVQGRHPAVLETLSVPTSGRNFSVPDLEDFATTTELISRAIRHEYVLGYGSRFTWALLVRVDNFRISRKYRTKPRARPFLEDPVGPHFEDTTECPPWVFPCARILAMVWPWL